MNVSDRFEAAKNELAAERLRRCPHLLPATVAHHYAALASVAAEMSRVVEMGGIGGAAGDLLNHLLDVIEKKHVEDFGEGPSWARFARGNPPLPPPPPPQPAPDRRRSL